MRSELDEIAQQLVADGRGILAADESTPTIGKRLAAVNVGLDVRNPSCLAGAAGDDARARALRAAGMILYDETIRQQGAQRHTAGRDCSSSSTSCRGSRSIWARSRWPAVPDEMVNEKTGGTACNRLAGVLDAGRPVRQVAGGDPHRRWTAEGKTCLSANAHALARYAALCQEAGSWCRSSSRRC